MIWIFANVTIGLSLFLVAYHHAVYPALLLAVSKFNRPRQLPEIDLTSEPESLPAITLIIPAHNEAAVINEKIRNLSQLNYPKDKLTIILALDGCSDDTMQVARSAISDHCQHLDFNLVQYKQNIGKISVLNQQIGSVRTDLVALNDASALINENGLRYAAASFTDPDAGVVFATYRLRESGSEGERAYTLFQTNTKAKEAGLDSPIGGHGALYFIRKSLWTPMPADTINDDFILPMGIIAAGKKGIYDQRIVATEIERTHVRQEFQRRIRIGAGNMQQVLRLPKLANPLRPWLALTYISGKGLRPFLPFLFLYALLVTSVMSVTSPPHLVLLLALLAFLLVGALVTVCRSNRTPKLLAWIGYLVEGHSASFIGAIRILTGMPIRGWQPTETVNLARR